MTAAELIAQAMGRITPFRDNPVTPDAARVERVQADFREQAFALILALIGGKLAVDAWLVQMKTLTTNYHLALYMLGVGGPNALDASDVADVLRIAGEQHAYLDGWAGDLGNVVGGLTDDQRALLLTGATAAAAGIASGGASVAMLKARALLYMATGWRTLQMAKAASVGIRLPVLPGEGSECKANCHCDWVIIPVQGGFDCYWRLGAAEHCPTCLRRAAEYNPLRIRGGVMVE